MKMRHIISIILSVVMIISLVGCGAPLQNREESTNGIDPTELKIGFLLLGDETDATCISHVEGLKSACKSLELDYETQTVLQYINEDTLPDEALQELAGAGCHIVFCADSRIEDSMLTAAGNNTGVQFCIAGGTHCSDDILSNTHSYFCEVDQTRYLTGIVAGMRTDSHLLGFIADRACPETISSFTSYYLGARSVDPLTTLYVIYTGEHSNETLESQYANELVNLGCDVLAQNTGTDSSALVAEENGIYFTGFNQNFSKKHTETVLVSTNTDWSSYYTFALSCILSGDSIPQDWSRKFVDDSCYLTALNESLAAPGTKESVESAVSAFTDGTLSVFSGPLYGKNSKGEILNLKDKEIYSDASNVSAPTFDYIIDGITILPQ